MQEKAFDLLEKVRQQKPVVHHLTNWVTIYDCAQIVKTIGGSPVMAHAPEEVADMAGIASALVLNIGTLTSDFVDAMLIAARAANHRRVPVILDACGAGATPFRDRKTAELLAGTRIDIIKGNASEIARTAGAHVRTKGVDSADVHADLLQLAKSLAAARHATVVVTGAEDLITDGSRVFRVTNGHEMMTRVVGTGCMAASVIGTFAAVEPDRAIAAACALATYGLAAELAASQSTGPASFKHHLFDTLNALSRKSCSKISITSDP